MELLNYKIAYNKIFEVEFDLFSFKDDLLQLKPGVTPTPEILRDTEVIFTGLCYKLKNKSTELYMNIQKAVINQIIKDWKLTQFENEYMSMKLSSWHLNYLDKDKLTIRISDKTDTLLQFLNGDEFELEGMTFVDNDTLIEIQYELFRMIKLLK